MWQFSLIHCLPNCKCRCCCKETPSTTGQNLDFFTSQVREIGKVIYKRTLLSVWCKKTCTFIMNACWAHAKHIWCLLISPDEVWVKKSWLCSVVDGMPLEQHLIFKKWYVQLPTDIFWATWLFLCSCLAVLHTSSLWGTWRWIIICILRLWYYCQVIFQWLQTILLVTPGLAK